MSELPGVDALLDLYLDESRRWWDGRRRPQSRDLTRGWRASQLGSCMQAQYRERLGEPRTREPDASARRAFAWGEMVEDFYRSLHQRLGLVLATQVVLRDDELDLSGHVDMLLRWPPQAVEDIPEDVRAGWSEEWLDWLRHVRDLVAERWPAEGVVAVEVKSTHSYSLPHLVREGEPRFAHGVQVGAYRLMAARNPEQMPATPDRWRLDYVGKDSVGVVTFGVPSRWADVALQRVSDLNRYLAEEREPADVPCECEGWMVEYCAYLREVHDGPTTRLFICCNGATYERAWKRGEKERMSDGD